MPRRDGTGPLSEGPITGLGLGDCIRDLREVTGDRTSRLGSFLRAGELCLDVARSLTGTRTAGARTADVPGINRRLRGRR